MLIGVGVSYRISYSVASYCVSFSGLNTSIGEHITKTSPCNEHPLKPHFYIVKVGFTGVFIFSYFCSKT